MIVEFVLRSNTAFAKHKTSILCTGCPSRFPQIQPDSKANDKGRESKKSLHVTCDMVFPISWLPHDVSTDKIAKHVVSEK